MKTKIRIQKAITNAFGCHYNTMAIDILEERYNGSKLQRDKMLSYLEPIGFISFQSNRDTPNDWYGMNFNVNTNNANHLMTMAKLAKFIVKNRKGYNDSPDEIIKLIGGEEYALFDSQFISKKDNGKSLFGIIKDNSLYARLIAADMKEAEKLLAKMKLGEAQLKFYTLIQI